MKSGGKSGHASPAVIGLPSGGRPPNCRGSPGTADPARGQHSAAARHAAWWCLWIGPWSENIAEVVSVHFPDWRTVKENVMFVDNGNGELMTSLKKK